MNKKLFQKLGIISLIASGVAFSATASELDGDAIEGQANSGLVIRENAETGAIEVYTFKSEDFIKNTDAAKAITENLDKPIFSLNKSDLVVGEKFHKSELDQSGESGTAAWVYYYYTPRPVNPYYAPGANYYYYTTPFTVNYYTPYTTSPYYATYYTPYYTPYAGGWNYYFYWRF